MTTTNLDKIADLIASLSVDERALVSGKLRETGARVRATGNKLRGFVRNWQSFQGMTLYDSFGEPFAIVKSVNIATEVDATDHHRDYRVGRTIDIRVDAVVILKEEEEQRGEPTKKRRR